jgi:hypothetical protein
MHAWRALAELRDPAVVPILLAMMDESGDDEWDDMIFDDFRDAISRVGRPALEPLIAYLKESTTKGSPVVAVADALADIAKAYPETQAAAQEAIVSGLAQWRDRPRDANAGLVAAAIELQIRDAMPVIREAMTAGAVDEMLVGTVEWVAFDLGLRDRPPTFRYAGTRLDPSTRSGVRSDRNPRERAISRRKQAKASKKRDRQNRR